MTLPGMRFPEPSAGEPTARRRAARPASTPKARDLDWSQIKLNHWIVAGTRVDQLYPCVCEVYRQTAGYSYCGRHCWCAGRTDTDHLPEGCCARRPPGRRQTRAVIGAPAPLPSLRPRSKLRPPAALSAIETLVSAYLV